LYLYLHTVYLWHHWGGRGATVSFAPWLRRLWHASTFLHKDVGTPIIYRYR